jgi:hypothetical protein
MTGELPTIEQATLGFTVALTEQALGRHRYSSHSNRRLGRAAEGIVRDRCRPTLAGNSS